MIDRSLASRDQVRLFPFYFPHVPSKERKKERKKKAGACAWPWLRWRSERNNGTLLRLRARPLPPHPTLKRKGINKAPSALRGRRRRRRPQSLIAVARKS